MPEMLSLSSMIVGKGQGDKVALLTDGVSLVVLVSLLDISLLKLRMVDRLPTFVQAICF